MLYPCPLSLSILRPLCPVCGAGLTLERPLMVHAVKTRTDPTSSYPAPRHNKGAINVRSCYQESNLLESCHRRRDPSTADCLERVCCPPRLPTALARFITVEPRASLARILTSLLSSQPVERVVALTRLANVAREGESRRRALDETTVLVDVTDGDLDGSVVLGLDDAASGGALAGDVEVDEVTLCV